MSARLGRVGDERAETFAERGAFFHIVHIPSRPATQNLFARRWPRRWPPTREHFAREGEIRFGAARFDVVENHGHAVARRLAEADVARDDGAKHFLLEELPHVGRDLLSEIRALVEHREQHAFDVERRVERGADAAHRADEIGEAFEREVLAVQRNQDRVGGDERVQRQQAERRRAVDEDVVEVVARTRGRARSRSSRAGERHQLDFGAGEIAIRGNQLQAIDGGRNDERPRVGGGSAVVSAS